MEQLPDPPDRFTNAADVAECTEGQRLWRIYFRGGPHPTSWQEFRHYGPTGSRFDPQEPPPSTQSRGVMYTATGSDALRTVIAELFQQTRLIDRARDQPWVVAFGLSADLSLLRTDRLWPVQAGGNLAINSGSRERARAWSRVVYDSYPTLSGIWYPSSLTNQPCAALYERAGFAIPRAPVFNEALNSARLLPGLTKIAANLGFTLR
jgi:hypothetical protein